MSAQDSFNILLLLGAGTGLLYLLRWFWWRITAWCEIVAMVVSFAVGITFLLLHKNGVEVHTARELIIGIAITTFCWVLTAYIGPPNDEEGAHQLLQEGAALRSGMGAHPLAMWHLRGRSGSG